MPVSGGRPSKSQYLVTRMMACSIFLSLALWFPLSTVSHVLGISLPSQSNRVLAADCGSLSGEQSAVAEASKLVDNSYFDRTFNKQDWFQMQQNASRSVIAT
jgi:hypothetical protein